MTEDLIDVSKEENKEKESKRRRNRDLSDMRVILGAVEGRRFIWSLLSRCQIFIESMTPETNPTFIEKGMRFIGLWVLNLVLDAKPESYVQMQQEYASEQKSNEKKESDLV